MALKCSLVNNQQLHCVILLLSLIISCEVFALFNNRLLCPFMKVVTHHILLLLAITEFVSNDNGLQIHIQNEVTSMTAGGFVISRTRPLVMCVCTVEDK